MPEMTNAEWRASRVNGGEIARDDYTWRKLNEALRSRGRLYSAANGWVVMRDPVLSKGQWNWIAERTTRGSVELRGFDQLSHARAWCAKEVAPHA